MNALNQNISFEKDFDVVIEEMLEREEFACTGNGCAGAACGVKDVEL